jgi:hypothetical protein
MTQGQQIQADRRWGMRPTARGWAVIDARGRLIFDAVGAVDLEQLLLDAAAAHDARQATAEDRRAARLLREGFAAGVHPRPRAAKDAEGNDVTEWDLHDAAGRVVSRDHGSPVQALLAASEVVRSPRSTRRASR